MPKLFAWISVDKVILIPVRECVPLNYCKCKMVVLCVVAIISTHADGRLYLLQLPESATIIRPATSSCRTFFFYYLKVQVQYSCWQKQLCVGTFLKRDQKKGSQMQVLAYPFSLFMISVYLTAKVLKYFSLFSFFLYMCLLLFLLRKM